MRRSNKVLFLKSKLISINIEENKNISDYLSRIKELKDKLDDIGEKVLSTNLVIVTLVI